MSRIFCAFILLPNNNPQANAVSAVKGNIGDNDAMKGTAGTFNPQQAEKSKPANPRKHRSFFIRRVLNTHPKVNP